MADSPTNSWGWGACRLACMDIEDFHPIAEGSVVRPVCAKFCLRYSTTHGSAGRLLGFNVPRFDRGAPPKMVRLLRVSTGNRTWWASVFGFLIGEKGFARSA